MTEESNKSSLLTEILSAAKGKQETEREIISPQNVSETPKTLPPITPENSIGSSGGSEEPPKKKKEPLNPITLLRGIGAIFLVAIIFFGSFLAYIVYNPEQAQFFVNTFGIDPRDVADLLRRLITGSFGVILLILSIVWIVTLFRAIWTPRDLKRKKILSWITAIFIGVILFSFIGFWAYLFNRINTTDFVNPQGTIGVYNSDLMNNPLTSEYALISNTSNLIGPISLTFEIAANASQIEKKSLFTIDSYEINFDGAICNDGSSVITGVNPTTAKGIVCLFDVTRLYNIQGTYRGTDRLGKESEVPMNINPVGIRGLLSIKKQKNRNNEDIITLDARSLRNLGNPRWVYESTGKEVNESSITEKLTSTPQLIGLRLFANDIDRLFLLENIDQKGFTGNILIEQDRVSPLLHHFRIDGLNIDDTDIVSIVWTLNDGSVICKGGSLSCDYTFGAYDTYVLRSRIELASGDFFILESPLKIDSPLIVSKRARVTDIEGKVLNTDETFDAKLRAFIIKDVIPPQKIIFDARDVVTENLGYQLENVSWKLSDGKRTEQKEGPQVVFDLTNPLRYTIDVEYTFLPNVVARQSEKKTSRETFIFDIEHKSLIPRVSLQIPSDYIPVIVTIDGSQSYAENSEIKKFTYDFGEGKPAVTGDAIQQYEYRTAGEKTISLTITNDKGESETLKKTIVLKENPKVVDFTPSISPAVTGVPVDFTPSVSESDISEYIWTFGDNTQSIKEALPSHTFTQAGNYVVTLTVVYNDGTRKEARKQFQVVDENNFQ